MEQYFYYYIIMCFNVSNQNIYVPGHLIYAIGAAIIKPPK